MKQNIKTIKQTLHWLKIKMQQEFALGNYALADDLQQEYFALRKYAIKNKL